SEGAGIASAARTAAACVVFYWRGGAFPFRRNSFVAIVGQKGGVPYGSSANVRGKPASAVVRAARRRSGLPFGAAGAVHGLDIRREVLRHHAPLDLERGRELVLILAEVSREQREAAHPLEVR